jgi:hypothetical protein
MLPTTPGQQYEFKFSMLSGYGRVGEQSQGNTGAPVNIYWGGDFFGREGQYLGVFRNASTSDWATYTFPVTAVSNSTIISFIDYTDKHWQMFDAISVVSVPEPSSGALMLVCLAVFGFDLRRKAGLKPSIS